MVRIYRRFLRMGMLLATVLGLLTDSGLLTRASAQELLTTAHQVTQTADWVADTYDWLSDHEVQSFRKTGKQIDPVRGDVTSEQQTHLSFMEAGWAAFGKAQGEAPSGLTASLAPDGKRLLWTVIGFDTVAIFATDVDGPHRFQFSYSGDSAPPSCLWLGDSQELVYFHTDAKGLEAHVLRLDKPNLDLETDSTRIGVQGPCGPSGPVLVTPDHRILSSDWIPGGPATATVHVMQATFAPPPAQGVTTGIATITLPQDTTVAEMRYSPQGDRIAWGLHSPQGARTTLWVCRADGTGWREFCHMFPPTEALYPDEPLTALRWLPSGKAISFLYDGALWVVPATER